MVSSVVAPLVDVRCLFGAQVASKIEKNDAGADEQFQILDLLFVLLTAWLELCNLFD